MEIIFQSIINGLSLGLVYILIASGLSLVLGIARIINFAHGEFYMLGAIAIYYLSTVYGVNFFLAMLISVVVLGALGWSVDKLLYNRVRGQFMPTVAVSLGVAFFIAGLALIVFGERLKKVETVFPGKLGAFGTAISLERLVIILVGLVVMAMLTYFVARFKAGKAMQAVAQDREAAALQGINVSGICALSMFIGCGLAAVAGALVAPVFFVDVFMGPIALFKGFVVILLGGVGTIPGAVVGGLLLGLVEAFGYTFLGTGADIIVFAMVIILLLIRPGGLLGRVWVLE